jgi:type IV pilus assembly protein PilA
MGVARTVRQTRFLHCAAAVAATFVVAWPCCAQSKLAGQPSELSWAQYLNKYPGLLPAIGELVDKLQHNVKFPEVRGGSRLLPLLPASTMSYAAFPNYGDVARQALNVFRQELQESSVLRDWWQHGDLAAEGPKLEDSLEKFSEFQRFLGEEIVVSGSLEGQEPKLLVVSEVRKPGLKKFLQQRVDQLAGNAKPEVRVFDPQELATAQDGDASQKFLVLVRPDFVVGALDLATLRGFSARLDRGSLEFVPTPFGRRVAQEYEGGVTILAATDLQKILGQVSPGTKGATFQRSGFDDVKYLVWEHKNVAGQTVSQAELSFNGPRHGPASWLAKSGPLSSLDFVSPKAMLAATVVLANPTQIFEDIKGLSGPNSNPFATLAPMEQALKLSLKDDLLRYLTGEVTVELDNVTPPAPVWKAIFKVNDAGRLRQTLSTLLAAGNVEAQRFEEKGATYYTVRVPFSKTVMEIGYAFVDGHLIVGSSREVVAEAVRLHKTGESLGKSKAFLASWPPGHGSQASALFYQDPIAMTALKLRQFAPEMAESLTQFSGATTPTVVCLYGEESAIREASSNGAFDVGAALVVAAIAIPNLLRSKIAANEALAVGTIRTMNTAEITYAATYPERGFAPDLATLGPDTRRPDVVSPDHAGLISEALGNESCAAHAWCTKSGFQFRIAAVCKKQLCTEYVAIGTPVDSNTGGRSFCSTSDALVRSKTGPPLTSPVSVAECRAWPPLQ